MHRAGQDQQEALQAVRQYHAGVHCSCFVSGAKHSGSDGLHVKVGLTLRHGDDADLALLQLEGHCAQRRRRRNQSLRTKSSTSGHQERLSCFIYNTVINFFFNFNF